MKTLIFGLFGICMFGATVFLFVLLLRALLKYLRSGEVRKEKTETKKTLGEALKAHRTRCKMTQEFVAEAIGVSRQAVSKWESGASDPSTSNLLALAKLYGVSAEELLRSDFKEFHIAEQNLGVGQITCIDSQKLLERKDELLDAMRKAQKSNSYDMVILMLTDVLQEGSQLLYIGSDDTIRNAFAMEPRDNAVFLPGVMSRKKQVIPMLTTLWG